MDLDFNPPRNAPAQFRRPRWRLPFLLLLLLFVLGILLLDNHESPTVTEASAVPEATAKPSPPPVPKLLKKTIDGTVQPGDTATSLLDGYCTAQELHSLAVKSRKVFPLSRLCAGQPFTLRLIDGAFDRFEYDIDENDQLIIQKAAEGFDVSRSPIPYAVKTSRVRGEIKTNLFDAVTDSGEDTELAVELANIFAWDIDFIRDIRAGDSFQVLVEKRFRQGQPAGYGRILAAEFTNRGESFRAFLFKDGDHRPAYYDAEGNSLRKAFLKAPLDFTRISSGYSMHRFHPITRTWKAHPAIDYAAPVGTPIKTVGDGTIYKIGYNRFNGNYIKIRHSNGYVSIYLHMTRFARGMKRYKRVAQGEVIGYVGATGLATGPHLCFRMRKNGEPINPIKLRSRSAAPVSKAHRAEFGKQIPSVLARLEGENLHQARLLHSGNHL